MDTHTPALTRRTLLATGGAAALAALAPAVASASPDRGLPETVALPDGLRPEGITSGPGTRFYVGSLADGRIVAGDLRTGSVRVLLPGAAGRSLRGLYHDASSGLVWAVGSLGADSYIWAVGARTGRVVAAIPVPGAVFLNDVVVSGGRVWVTDSRVDRLTWVRLGSGGRPLPRPARFVPLTGAWPAFDGSAINANGVRDLPDGSLVLNNSRVGGFWQVDTSTGATTAIEVTGGPAVISGDGLERDGRTLFDVRPLGGNEVGEFRLRRRHGGWSAVWVDLLTDPTLDVPSTATYAAGHLWAVNARFGVASPDTATYAVTRLDP